MPRIPTTWHTELQRLEYRDAGGLHRITLSGAAGPPGTTDHTLLTNLPWIGSGHTGTASHIATFDGAGLASSSSVATLNAALSHATLTAGSRVWTASGHTGTPSTLAGFDGAGAASGLAIPLTIGNGGTGQTGAVAAFDALSPTTTKGDLVVHDGADNIRVAVGADGRVLTADSVAASGVSWVVPAPITASYICAGAPLPAQGRELSVTGAGIGITDNGAGLTLDIFLDADLQAIAGLGNGIPVRSGGTWSVVTNPLPIANGGTGQTSQTPAFDALAPTTIKGDLIVHNGTDNIRVPVGTDTHVLTADSTLAAGVKWAAAGGGGGGGTATTVEVNLGATAARRGRFTITDAAISGTSKVLCWQAPGPYTGKGTREDEAEMDPVTVDRVVPAAGSAVVHWRGQVSQADPGRRTLFDGSGPISARFVRGNVKFSYTVLA
jgi:hypothetical protein